SALISNGSDPESHGLAGDFNGGYIEVTVPCTCVFNSEQNENGQTNHTFRGTSGSAVVGIHSDDDEQLTFGITPPEIAAEVAVGDDGLTYRRTIQAGGTEAWVLA
ncbi:MAG: hypothetical protein HRU13_13540, partial [Phycisphaerales bacterium]|nr:hypothetical protein [Phycisphaerales bacterium]